MKLWMIVRVFVPVGMGIRARGSAGGGRSGGSGRSSGSLLLMIERRLLAEALHYRH